MGGGGLVGSGLSGATEISGNLGESIWVLSGSEKFGALAVQRTAGRGGLWPGPQISYGILDTSQTPRANRAEHINLSYRNTSQ